MIRLDDLLARHRAAGPAARVLIGDDGSTVDLDRFQAMIAGTEGWLRDQGLERGDRIAVMMLNRPEWLAILFAAARMGVAVAVVNTRYRTHEVHHIVRSSGARMLIVQDDGQKPDFVGMLAELAGDDLPELQRIALLCDAEGLARRQGSLCRPLVAFDPAPAAFAPDTASNPDDPLIFFTTSGTTSLPKLVVHTQRTMSLHASGSPETLGFGRLRTTGLLGGLPFCGVFGLNPTLGAIAAGLPVQMMATFDAGQAVAHVRREGLSHMLGSDEMYRRMLDLDEGILREMSFCGFGAFTPGLLPGLTEAARAGAPLAGVYGSSEVHAIFAVQRPDMPIDERVKGGGLVASVSGARLQIVDPETGEALPHGQAGLLRIRADSNFAGYWNNPEATAKAVDADGFFTTGDLAYLRADGSFVYLARMGDTIRLSGFLTDPGEIEEALKDIAGLPEVQVIGIEIDGQSRAAAFVRHSGPVALDQAAIQAALRARIASYKVPARIWAIDEFPTIQSANGRKIQKKELRQWALDRLASEKASA